MNRGHNSPSSKLMIVPDAAPTANRIANTFDQRRASARQVGIPGTQMHPLRNQHHQRQPNPEHREEQVKTQRRPHLPATSRQVTDRTKRNRHERRPSSPGPSRRIEAERVLRDWSHHTVLRSIIQPEESAVSGSASSIYDAA